LYAKGKECITAMVFSLQLNKLVVIRLSSFWAYMSWVI